MTIYIVITTNKIIIIISCIFFNAIVDFGENKTKLSENLFRCKCVAALANKITLNLLNLNNFFWK